MQQWDEERAIDGGVYAPVPLHAPDIVVSNNEHRPSDSEDTNLPRTTAPRHYTDLSISDTHRDGPMDTEGWDSSRVQGGSRPVGAGAAAPSPPPSYHVPGR